MSKAIGIDLGTTNSAVSIYRAASSFEKGMPLAIPIGKSAIFPSCILLRNGKFIAGREAYENRFKPSAVYSIKRKMGTQETVSLVDEVTGQTRVMTPVEVSAEILKAMLEGVKSALGEIDEATITVPAYFTPTQKMDTYAAGELAGLKKIHIINEPTAAALAYQLETDKPETVLIFDLGGGTFDISVVQIVPATADAPSDDFLSTFYNVQTEGSVAQSTIVQVLDSDGNNMLGGDDIDEAILRRILFNYSRDNGVDLFLTEQEKKEAILKIEEYKKLNMGGTFHIGDNHALSVKQEDIQFGYNKIMRKCIELTEPMLKKYAGRIDRIILVGGSTKSPYVTNYLQSYIGKVPVHVELNPDEAVSLGASVNSAIQSDQIDNLQFFDIVPEAISIETMGGSLLTIIEKGAMLPAIGAQKFDIAMGTSANINVHYGSGDATADSLLGHVVLTPEDSKEQVTVTLSVDLDSILHIKATTQSVSTAKTLVRVSNLQAVNAPRATGSERVHKQRIRNLTATLKDIESIGEPEFANAFISNLSSAINEYSLAEDKEAIYNKHKKLFKKATNGLSAALAERSSELINISFNTARGGELVANEADTGGIVELSQLFQSNGVRNS